MIEFEVGGNQYRAERMDAMKQFHVSRKLAPIIPSMLPVLGIMKDEQAMQNDMSALSTALQPLADGLAGLTDEHSEYVIAACLSVVQRKTGDTTWAPVWNRQSNSCAFDNMDLGDIFAVVIEVVKDSLGSFISGLLTKKKAEQ